MNPKTSRSASGLATPQTMFAGRESYFTKSFTSVMLKGVTPSGGTRLVVARLNVVDSDGDVTLRGFFGTQHAVVLPAHDWSSVPLGKGLIHEDGDDVLVDVDWNLDVPAARSWFSAVKFDVDNPPVLQEWSYGFTVKPGGATRGEWGGRPVQLLGPLKDGSPGAEIHEVSPVVLGAGVGTRTVSVSEPDSTPDANVEAARAILASLRDDDVDREALDREYARFVQSGLGVS